MNIYIISRPVRVAFFSLLLSQVFMACQQKGTDPDPAPSASSTQRITAQTENFVRKFVSQINLKSITIAGEVLQINAVDSTNFRYDNQRRLTGYDKTQSFCSDDKKITLPTLGYTYAYGSNTLTAKEAISQDRVDGVLRQYPLDNAQSRVLAYSKNEYSYIFLDTLRQYSSEGILTNAFQGVIYPGSFPQKLSANTKVTVDGGNIIQIDEYNFWSGALEKVTRLTYDNTHFAPSSAFTFLGETSKNALLKKTVVYYSNTTSDTTEYNYYNEYDSQGRMTRQLEYVTDKTSTQKEALKVTNYYY